MTPEAQRIAIAEVLGKHIYFGVIHATGRCTVCGDYYGEAKHRVPDYLNDLNAMHEAEQTLTSDDGELWRTYCRTLLEVSGRVEPLSFEDFTFAIDATATQRAEAFLRTLGKWEDGK